jgi:hypothetical protein
MYSYQEANNVVDNDDDARDDDDDYDNNDKNDDDADNKNDYDADNDNVTIHLPDIEAGTLIDPPPSNPIAIGTIPDATATAEPEEEPPL